ncbi:estradiol 17-beta-dehydrogenase 11-like [Chironomus tepperi]|uniref:estradiol 17-beta-dehydrogenase 11-like n=1 Tax=Chironomus tepperi TaxID=113505 RepID=UPI00391FA7A3
MDITKVMQNEYKAADTASESNRQYKFKLLQIIFKVIELIILDYLKFFTSFFKKTKQPDNIANQLALVTGGGNGLGRALCYRLAREKCDLAIVDIDYNAAQRTANDISEEFNVKCKAYQCDISNNLAILKLKDDIESEMRSVDILVNNAGLLYVTNFMTSKIDDIQKTVQVNLTSHIMMTRIFLNGMIERQNGRILTICSMASLFTSPALTVYCATKMGLSGFMQALSDELYINNYHKFIKLTSIYPDFINTRQEVSELLDQMKHFLPRLTPEKVANVAVSGMLKNKQDIIVSEFKLLFSNAR